ncbi:iron-siderophore ABC transporter substrate-binding protein [Arenibaculum sp.]|uniref:ABC transporter substrate-binding protein n=1 Tax=Arenibaculum sp. TaxID=2865862 RepID=UPI002E142911|nr:iron-siderophore ABC transporter substrate-binding protein [Arenibaculum sp.]
MRIFLLPVLVLILAFASAARADRLEVPHALGTAVLEGVPERIVVLDLAYAEALAAVGVSPVGVADLAGYRQWVGVGAERLAGAADVGTRQEPSLEAIAALRPDLILGPAFRHAAIHDQLSAIAPTVLFEGFPADGQGQFEQTVEDFRAVARMVGREEEGERVLADMDAVLDRGRERLAQAGLAGAPVLVAQFLPGSPSPRVFTDGSLVDGVIDRLGLVNAWKGPAERFGFTTAGIESLAAIRDAHLLHIVQPGDDVFQRLGANPVWPRLDFVANDRVHALPSDTWTFGGPLSVSAMAGRVADALLP